VPCSLTRWLCQVSGEGTTLVALTLIALNPLFFIHSYQCEKKVTQLLSHLFLRVVIDLSRNSEKSINRFACFIVCFEICIERFHKFIEYFAAFINH
jgi:hypothetical protein